VCWVGLGQSADELGWIRSHKMDPRTTLKSICHKKIHLSDRAWFASSARMRPFPTRVTRSVVLRVGRTIELCRDGRTDQGAAWRRHCWTQGTYGNCIGWGLQICSSERALSAFFVLREGSGAYYTVDSIRLLVHIVCFPTDPFSSLFLTYILPYVSFPLRIDPLRFRAGCRNRRVKPGFSFLCVYFVL